ncbi:tubulin alpha chain-like isoform X3 [Xiphophorus couchianus]|uniref:tubulin alpha chain-like isoform X3 n=1 Tax=Xiphophorus couchianus TaxID=32473 RepID=UPI00101656A6|nr:tubulin alpha chain-like isoform X3 [Xiphophorus couchianus]
MSRHSQISALSSHVVKTNKMTDAGCWEPDRIQLDLLMPTDKTSGRGDSSNTFFIETVFGKHVPRSVCVNPQPTVIVVNELNLQFSVPL